MTWTEPCDPKPGVSSYDHVICETPLGKILIEWKSWKENPDYSIMLDDEYIGDTYSLEEAKDIAMEHLVKKYNELKLFLAL